MGSKLTSCATDDNTGASSPTTPTLQPSHVMTSPDKYISHNASHNKTTYRIGDPSSDPRMDQILAENRRLQLLCDKMLKTTAPTRVRSSSNPTKSKKASNDARKKSTSLDVLDFFGDDCDSSVLMQHAPLATISQNSLKPSKKTTKKPPKKSNFFHTTPPSPNPWSEHTDPKTGKSYMHNSQSGESVWKEHKRDDKENMVVFA